MHTWTQSQNLVRALLLGPAMLLMGAMAISSGCIVPPYQAAIPEENTPPRFGKTDPPPSQIKTHPRTPAGESPNIFVITSRVTDPDPQQLRLRAFGNADYEKEIDIAPDFVDPVSREDGLRLFEVKIQGLCDTEGWLQPAERKHHTLELYVTDGEFVGTTGREVATGGRDSMSWVIACEDLPSN